MAVGGPGNVAGRDVKHRGAELLAERDHVGDSRRVHFDCALERRLEVHQARAVHDRVDAAALEWLHAFGEQAGLCDIAGNDSDAAFDICLEARAEMLADGRHHGRLQHLAPEAVVGGAMVAADEQVDAVYLGMPSQEQRKEHLAEKSGRAGEQDPAFAKNLLERRHCGRSASARGACAVAIRHRQSPAEEDGDR
jgi:hypothetical protein